MHKAQYRHSYQMSNRPLIEQTNISGRLSMAKVLSIFQYKKYFAFL